MRTGRGGDAGSPLRPAEHQLPGPTDLAGRQRHMPCRSPQHCCPRSSGRFAHIPRCRLHPRAATGRRLRRRSGLQRRRADGRSRLSSQGRDRSGDRLCGVRSVGGQACGPRGTAARDGGQVRGLSLLLVAQLRVARCDLPGDRRFRSALCRLWRRGHRFWPRHRVEGYPAVVGQGREGLSPIPQAPHAAGPPSRQRRRQCADFCGEMGRTDHAALAARISSDGSHRT